jgi:hypothetical protein
VACRQVGPNGEQLVTMVVPVDAAEQIAEHGGGILTTATTIFTSVTTSVLPPTTFTYTTQGSGGTFITITTVIPGSTTSRTVTAVVTSTLCV